MLARQLAAHLCVAVHAGGALEALGLDGPGGQHTPSYSGAALRPLLPVQLAHRHGRHLDVQVDTVHQGTADFVQIALHGTGGAGALHRGVVVVAARTGVHGGDEHERGGIVDGHLGPADGHAALLHGLAQHLEHRALEFRQLVEEEHPVVRQADLARLGVGAAAHEGHVADGVVRGPEGAHGNERVLLAHETCHTVYLRGLQALAQCERWQDARHALGKHALAAARRAYHDGVVPAGGGNLEAALHALLSFHVGEVVLIVVEGIGKLGTGVDHRLLNGGGTVEEFGHLLEAFGSIDFQVVHYGCLAGVGGGHYDAFALAPARLDGYGQHPFDGSQAAVQAQLAHDDVAVHSVGLHHAHGTEDAYGQRQVVGRALFPQVGGRHVHHVALVGYLEVRFEKCRRDALDALLHRVVRQTDDGKARSWPRRHLHGDSHCLHSQYGTAVGLY